MAFDDGNGIQDAIDWAVRVLQSFGTFLPIGIFLLVSIFGRGKGKKQQQDQGRPAQSPKPMTTTQPTRSPAPSMPLPDSPIGPIPLPTMSMSGETPARPRPDRQWGGAFDREEGEVLRWGSAFDDGAGGKLKWGSEFDSQREQTKWGFDDTEWSSGFGPKRESEPKITVG